MRITFIGTGGLYLGLVAGVLFGSRGSAAAQESPQLERRPRSFWAAEVGDGFSKGANEVEVLAGAGFGMRILGSRGQHDLAVGAVQYGWVVRDMTGGDHWYRGNWEVLGQIFGMRQFHPEHDYVAGGGPLLRYNFATGTRWVPFADAGAGVTATNIRGVDLSTTFEFNLQLGAGVHYFLRDNMALTLQYRYIHISNAGMDTPNLGVNTSNGLLGLTWFF